MSPVISKPKRERSEAKDDSGRLFFLDLGGGRVMSAKPFRKVRTADVTKLAVECGIFAS